MVCFHQVGGGAIYVKNGCNMDGHDGENVQINQLDAIKGRNSEYQHKQTGSEQIRTGGPQCSQIVKWGETLLEHISRAVIATRVFLSVFIINNFRCNVSSVVLADFHFV